MGSKVWRAAKRGDKHAGAESYNARDFNHDGKDELGIANGLNGGTSSQLWYTRGTKINLTKFSTSDLETE